MLVRVGLGCSCSSQRRNKLPDVFKEFEIPNKQDAEMFEVTPGISGHFKNNELTRSEMIFKVC